MNNKKEKKIKQDIQINRKSISNISYPTCEYINYKKITTTSEATYSTVLTGDRPMYAKNIGYN